MHSRWFNAAVVMLWMATMTWLVKQKVLPPLLVGEPPSTERIIEAQKLSPPVGWRIAYKERTLGWAVSETVPQPSELTEIHGRVHFDHLPLRDMMKGWLRAFSKYIEPMDGMGLDGCSVANVDALGHLVSFESAVRLDPLDEVVRMQGTVEGRQLQLTVRTGGVAMSSSCFLPTDAVLTDALSPQAQLPGLRAGQEWSVPVYSPLLPAKNPLEIIHARVDSLQSISWNGATEACWLVLYRSDPVSGASEAGTPRGRLWVRRDGTVLRQQVLLFDSVITFERLSEQEAAKLVAAAGNDWWEMKRDSRVEGHD